eukprot:6091460-Pleurochrysis_carterae.AAC.1
MEKEHLGVEHAILPVPENGYCQFHAVVACLMQSSQRFVTKHLGLLPEMPPKSSALQFNRVLQWSRSLILFKFIAERESYSISESLLETRNKDIKTCLRRFQPPPRTLYNPELKESYEEMYNKMVPEQHLNNGQLACFDDKTLAET